jgi:UDPglucose 6-dehydrogenase
MTVTIIGCGYVGLTTAVILANCGFEVRAVEVNQSRLKSIQSGKSFFYEVGVDPLLQAGLASGALTASDDVAAACAGSDVIFSCVGTPDNPDGSSNLTYVFDVARAAMEVMGESTIFVQKSTVPVGTGKRITELFREHGTANPYVSNPEFLREGSAIADSLWFDRTVTGSDDSAAASSISDIYRQVESRRDTIGALATIDTPAKQIQSRYFETSLASAELIKVTANAFLALKISFANSIAKLADQADADVVEVMDAVGADNRIGRAFLNAGRGYGGGCFPKDVSGLIRSAEDYGVAMEIMSAASDVNEGMVHYIISMAAEAFGGSFHDTDVTVLGLSFKAGTSDTRRSPAIAIANTLASRGARVQVYDPAAIQEAKPDLEPAIVPSDNLADALRTASCVFIGTEWPEFKTIDWQQYPDLKLVVDAMNILDPVTVKAAGKHYLGVGHR